MSLLGRYVVDEDQLITDAEGRVPLVWWTVAPNFGDLLSPYLFRRLSRRKVARVHVGPKFRKDQVTAPAYIAVGSILSRAQDSFVAWGTGSFGTEQAAQISAKCRYTAVRGPLTRSFILNQGGQCPEVYGDPGLLMPQVYAPEVAKRHDVGFVIRWSDEEFREALLDEGVKVIDLGRSDVEQVVHEMLECRTIATSSLHGLIIADAYGIPNAWLSSHTPKGGEFKYFDYFLSVDKVRRAQYLPRVEGRVDARRLRSALHFDDRPIHFDPATLLDACPLLKHAA
ncbi:polysaccharide pyruvyl transferase family protein [Ideonella livida]|uniref:Polysaccharide pyruvyl transferase family protein n=1 Tax=Ideonella livida TaxID=2707176 RepID=A0A7C9TJN9_9BURK|nr:polysaccharide pyruvyl transferase family protein [Ideonella livida]NDY90367.1 polysaccharide pyruvyl transferase family protein [Ideonella livida]